MDPSQGLMGPLIVGGTINKRASVANTSTNLGTSNIHIGNGLSSKGLLSSEKDFFNSTAPINMQKYMTDVESKGY